MVRTMADRNDVRPVLLVYGNGEWDDVAFRDELERLKDRLDLTLVHVLERPPHEWRGETGYITTDVLARIVPSFTEATRVEEDCKRKIGIRKIVPGRPARTGRKARTNLGTLSTGQGADDRCLPGLHFAKEPDHRWWQALTQTAQGSLERLSFNLRSKELVELLKHNNGTFLGARTGGSDAAVCAYGLPCLS